MSRRAIAGLFLFLFCACGLSAQTATLRGKILSAEDRSPVAGATVQLRGTLLGAASNSSGVFTIERIPPGRYDLVVTMVGFKKLIMPGVDPSGAEDVPEFLLEPSAIQTDPVIVSAGKHEQDAMEVAATVSVLDAAALVERQIVTVDDALRYVPGVTMTQSQVNIRGTTGYSYGVGSRVLILVDGVPLLSGDTGEIIWESIPVQNIERIEVLKGAGSALYGSSALGGVINIITKTPGDRPVTTVKTYGGLYQMPSFTTWNWSPDTRTLGGVSVVHQNRAGEFFYTAGGSRTLNDGYRQNDYWKRWNIWSTVGYVLAPMQTLSLDFNLLDQSRASFLYWKNLTYAFQPADDQLSETVSSTRWHLGASYRSVMSSALSLKVAGGWYHSRWGNNIPSMGDSAGTVSVSDAATLDAQTIVQASDAVVLIGGLVVNRNAVDAGAIFGKRSSSGGAAYFQAEFRPVRQFLVTAGLRADLQKIDSLAAFSRVNPKLGVTYLFDDVTSAHASAGAGFRTPTIAEVFTTTEAGGLTILPNPSLQPERSWSAEVGVRRRWSDLLSVDCSVFRNDVTDLIEPSFSSDGNVHFQNVTHAVVSGIELSLQAAPFGDRIPLSAGYTYVDPENVSTHTVLKYRPRHSFTGNVQVRFSPLVAGVDYRYLSRVEEIDRALVDLGVVPDGDTRVAVSVFDLNAGVEGEFLGAKTSLALHIRNLFRYYYTDFIGNIAAPRSWTLSLETTIP